MSRVVNLKLGQKAVFGRCLAKDIGVSAIEDLPNGGVRLVCMSSQGAATIRRELKAFLIDGEVTRKRHRPPTPFW